MHNHLHGLLDCDFLNTTALGPDQGETLLPMMLGFPSSPDSLYIYTVCFKGNVYCFVR